MEQTTIKNLPSGTLKGLEREAKKEGFVFFNQKANVQSYIRYLLAKGAGLNTTQKQL